MVRYRHEAGAGKLPQDPGKAGKVESAMHGGHEGHAEPTEQRKGQPVDVRVDHVEVSRALGDRLQQHGAGGIWIDALPPETQRARPHGMKLAFRPGVAAREQRDVVTELDQLIHQPRHDPLRAAVELRRDAFGQGSKLSDAHRCRSSRPKTSTGRTARWPRRRVLRWPATSNLAWRRPQLAWRAPPSASTFVCGEPLKGQAESREFFGLAHTR